jgi:hypothetical protein
MATQNTYKIVRYGDRKWIEVFLEALQKGLFNQASFNGISGIAAVTVKNSDELPELMKFISDQNAGVLSSVSANKGGLSVSVVRIDSPLHDELRFNWNPQNQKPVLPDEERVKIISWFTSELVQLDPERGLFTGTDVAEAAQNELALRSATIERFEQVQAKLAEDTAAFNKTIQDNYLTEKAKLDDQLEEERGRLKKEFTRKKEELDKRAAELDEREANIDASDNTAARRQIRKDLLAELQRRSEKFALTSGTKRLRWPVHVVSLAIIVAGLVGAYFFGTKMPAPENSNGIAYTIAIAKPFGLTFAAIATAFFYLRWLNRWFEQHAQAEFKLKQFQLDIERASWLVETALDWDAKQKNDLPKELLEGLSRNLFSFEDEKIDQVRHPVDELASALMGTASKVKLNIGGNEVELDGKRLNKAAKNS